MRRIDRFVLQCIEKITIIILACHQPITTELCHRHRISVENRMNSSAFRDIWAGVIFFKITRAARNARAILRFLISNILKGKKK